MTTPQVISLALALLAAPSGESSSHQRERESDAEAVSALRHRPEPGPSRGEASPREGSGSGPIEIVVDTKPDWLFPGLDHPRVQAYFRSDSTVGGSLFDEPARVVQRPLVRAGSIAVHGADDRAERTAARRFARQLVADVRPALEACYADVLQRHPTDAARLVLHVELAPDNRGAVKVSSGMLGDVFGNACVHGVLEFADVDAPAIGARVDIPVWFWLQSI